MARPRALPTGALFALVSVASSSACREPSRYELSTNARDGASAENSVVDATLDASPLDVARDERSDALDASLADQGADAVSPDAMDAGPDALDAPRDTAPDAMDAMDAGGSEPSPDAAADVPADLPFAADGALPVGRTFLVSASSTGGTSNSGNYLHSRSVSADGRYVVFTSYATNLVDGVDTNNGPDVFIRDVVEGTTRLVSHALRAETTAGSLPSFQARISSDGRWVLFVSTAVNLVDPSMVPSGTTLYLYDRVTQQNSPALATGMGGFYPCAGCNTGPLSASGRYFTFSTTSMLIPQATGGGRHVYRYDTMFPSALRWLSGSSSGMPGAAARDELCGGMRSGGGRDATIGDFVMDGANHYLVYFTAANALVSTDTDDCTDVFLSRPTSSPLRCSVGLAGFKQLAAESAVDGGGQLVAYSATGAAVPEDRNGTWDVYLQPTAGSPLSGLRLASVTREGASGNNASGNPMLSSDGRVLGFVSLASDLLGPAEDTNGVRDLFVRVGTVTTRVSLRDDGSQLSLGVAPGQHALSENGDVVVFATEDPALPARDGNTYSDIYLRRWR